MKKVAFAAKPVANGLHRTADEWVGMVAANAEPMKRLTIDIPLSLHQRVKSQCALQGLKMADVMREMLEQRFPSEANPASAQN